MRMFPRIRSKRMIFLVALIALVLMVVYAVVHYRVVNSEPYKLSERYILGNSQIVNRLGSNLQCNLGLLSDYSVLHHTTAGVSYSLAAFDVTVRGVKGRGLVKVKLEKKENGWIIVSAILYDDRGGKIQDLL